MKFTTVTAVLGGAAAVSAHPGIETNAKRLARGLPPLPPARRGTPVKTRTSWVERSHVRAAREDPSAESCEKSCFRLLSAVDIFLSVP